MPVASGSAQAVSILSPEEVASMGGLPGPAVAGFIGGDPPSFETFRPNRVFIDFMHEVIASAGPRDPSLIQAAEEQGSGYVYLIDLRTPEGPRGNVPSEDVVGAFEVEAGRLVAGSYAPNPEHRVLSRFGLVQLPPFIRRELVSELTRIRDAGAGGPPSA